MTASEPSIALLLAQERSGTHMLRSILGRMRRIAAPGEVCNAAADLARENELSFFKFRRAHLLDDANSPYPTAKIQLYLIDKYFTHLASHYPGRDIVICDIKYSHVHNFNLFHWELLDRPFLLSYARTHQIRILHLVRENIFHTALSGLYAAQSGVWRASDPDQVKKIRITVDREALGRRMNTIGAAVGFFDEWLRGCINLRITYEDLCGPAPQIPLRKISNFLGLEEVIPFKPGFVKTTPPYEECIVNWDEIRELGATFERSALGLDIGSLAPAAAVPPRRGTKHGNL